MKRFDDFKKSIGTNSAVITILQLACMTSTDRGLPGTATTYTTCTVGVQVVIYVQNAWNMSRIGVG
jgi:hypothetical protein